MIGEIVGGIIAHSIAIQTDAAHMAADIAGFFFSIVALYISNKEPTRRMSFGYYRSEVLGALFSTLLIWILTGVLIYLAVLRIINEDYEIDSIAMVATASCGVVFNIIMYFILHTNKCVKGVSLKHHGHSHSGDGHGHSHGHSHSSAFSTNSHNNHSNNVRHSNSTPINKNIIPYGSPINDNFGIVNASTNSGEVNSTVLIEDCSDKDIHIPDDSSNINLRAAAIHVIGDFIQSVGVLIAALIIHFKPDYKIADPICTFIFSALVFATTVPILKDIYFVLMEGKLMNFKPLLC
jgi:zinc transporter 2